MRNGHISFGVFLAFMAGCVAGNVNYSDSVWLVLTVWVIALSVNFLAFSRVDRGLKDELEKAELRRRAAGK